MKKAWVSCAALLAAAVATAHGDPTLNGCRDAGYSQLWVQSQPTSFGDNQPGLTVCPPPGLGTGISVSLNNSNIAGISGTPCDASTGAGVTTGAEFKIPFSTLGNPTAATIRIVSFINGGGHDFLSNQVVNGPSICANLGEPRNVNFGDEMIFPGNQFLDVMNSADVVAAIDAPVIDGSLDAAFYGAALFIQMGGTQFGDSTDGTGGGGSEIDGAYARVATVDGVKSLYLLITGNLERNFNKMEVFIDTATLDGMSMPEGQNTLRGDNAGIDFNGLNRMGTTAPGNGLTFDADFTADYYLTITNGNTAPTQMFVNFAELLTGGGGAGLFLGQVDLPGTFTRTEEPCTPMPLPIPSPDIANGSELDSFSMARCGDFLYLHFAGNLASDNSKLEVFFDVGTIDGDAGQNQIRGDNVDIDFGALNRLGDDLSTAEVEGLTFDSGFSANYWLRVRTGGLDNNTDAEMFLYGAQLRAAGAAGELNSPGLLDYAGIAGGPKSNPMFNPLFFNGQFCVRDDGMMNCTPHNAGTAFNPLSLIGLDVQGDLALGGGINDLPTIGEIRTSFAPRILSGNPFDPLGTQSPNPNLATTGLVGVAIDNSNIDGVTGDMASMAAAQAVATGVEVQISLAELGWKGGPIRVAAFLNGTNGDLVSNQVLGASVGAASLGDPRLINFSDEMAFPGNQFIEIADVTLLPCPAAAPCPTVNPPCPGDYNDDGQVDLLDLLSFNGEWSGNLGTMVPAGTLGDYDGSGTVDLLDLLSFNGDWSSNLGTPCP